MNYLKSTLVAALVICSIMPAEAQRRRSSSNSDFELTREDVALMLNQGEASANRTASGDGLRTNTVADRGPVVKRPTRMHIAVVDRGGKVLGLRSMVDAWVGSEDIAIGKARTAAFFSSDENALTSRIIGELSQVSTDKEGKLATGPLWGIGGSNQQGITGDKQSRNGLITFPGGVAIYKNGRLVGGVGVSGDGVDQDESVAFGAAASFEPGANAVKLGYKSPTVPAMEGPSTAVPAAGATNASTTETIPRQP